LRRLFGNTDEKTIRRMAEHMCMVVDLKLPQATMARIIENHKTYKIEDVEFDLILNLFGKICRPTVPDEIRTLLVPLKQTLVWNPGNISLRYLIDYEQRQEQKKLDNPSFCKKLTAALKYLTHTQSPGRDDRNNDWRSSNVGVPRYKTSGNVLFDLLEDEESDSIEVQVRRKSIAAIHPYVADMNQEKYPLVFPYITRSNTS